MQKSLRLVTYIWTDPISNSNFPHRIRRKYTPYME